MNEEELHRKRKTFTVKLSKFELLHLRDLFSVMLPPEMKDTLSQRLASGQDRSLIEAKLWTKISTLCEEAGIPVGEDAPDFVVAASSAPSISVFEMSHDPDQLPVEEVEEGQELFGGGDCCEVAEEE